MHVLLPMWLEFVAPAPLNWHFALNACDQVSYFWVVQCTFAAEEDYETPTGAISQMPLSDNELTAITTLEREVCGFLCSADARNWCLECPTKQLLQYV